MKCPLLFTGTVPEFDTIHKILGKEFSEFCGDCCRIYLVWMGGRVKYLSCDMEGVDNDYDILYAGVSDNLINTTSDCEELSLSSGNINGPM